MQVEGDHAAAVLAEADQLVHPLDVRRVRGAVEALAADLVVALGELVTHLLSEVLLLMSAEEACDKLHVLGEVRDLLAHLQHVVVGLAALLLILLGGD